MRRLEPRLRAGIRLVLLLLLFVSGLTIRVQADDRNNDAATSNESTRKVLKSSPEILSSHRPTIYTFFQQIDANNRTTGMTNDDDTALLSFWKERWEDAGFAPVILTSETIYSPILENQNALFQRSHLSSFTTERYESVRTKIDTLPLDDFGKILYRRWLAMAAVGGGWFSDYDNFPLWNLDNEKSTEQPQMMSREDLQAPTKMTVYDMLSPTLASGSGIEWLDTLEALLDDTIEKCPPLSNRSSCFYTDALAIHSLKTNQHSMAPKTARKVAFPFDKNDPVSFDDPSLCSTRNFRTKVTVHFGPEVLQRGRHVPPKLRHPKHRSSLAREWLDRWQELCHKKTLHPETMEDTMELLSNKD